MMKMTWFSKYLSYGVVLVVGAYICAGSNAYAQETVCKNINASYARVDARIVAQKKRVTTTYSSQQALLKKEFAQQDATLRANHIANDKQRQLRYAQMRAQAGTDAKLLEASDAFKEHVNQAVDIYYMAISKANAIYRQHVEDILSAQLILDTKALDAYATSTKEVFDKAKSECLSKDVRSGLRASIALSRNRLDIPTKKSIQSSLGLFSKERQGLYQGARTAFQQQLREAEDALPEALKQ